MKEIFEVAAAILASLGGGAAIVLGISSWLGKVWANKILEEEKAKYNKELEFYKAELKKELDNISVFQDKALYISKAQYDNEYKIYQEIWEIMQECIKWSRALFNYRENELIDYEKKEQIIIKQRYELFKESFNEYLKIIDKYAPFYKKEYYDEFVKIRDKCSELGGLFNKYKWSFKYEDKTILIKATNGTMTKNEKKICIDNPKELKDISEKLQVEIRDYLLNLRLK